MRTTNSLERDSCVINITQTKTAKKTTAGRTVKWKVTTGIQLRPQLGLSRETGSGSFVTRSHRELTCIVYGPEVLFRRRERARGVVLVVVIEA